MTPLDYVVLGVYFAFMMVIGWVLRRFVRDVSDYFRGGGRAVWWLVGGSAFMVAFSAWTFTGAASQAYSDGWPVLVIYLSNVVGFLLAAFYFAPRFRQIRAITAVEAVRHRFDRIGEQVFVWLQIPLGTIRAGIWLSALSVFFSAVLGFDLMWTIVVTGAVTLCMALLGGTWAVLAGDFIQMLVLMPVSVVVALLVLARLGGWSGFVAAVPAAHLDVTRIFDNEFVGLWCVAMLCKQVAVANNLLEANRFLSAKDSSHARRAGLLGAALFAVGAIVWFIPPIAARALWPELHALFPQLRVPEEASFLAMAQVVMPTGMMGLLVSGIFASTMASMDSGLNKNAGIFVKNFYQPLLRPAADDAELLRMGRLTTIVLGIAVTALALWMSEMKGLGLFVLMQRVSILIGVPILVPLVLGMVVRRTPPWSAWSTVLVGFLCSIACAPQYPADVAGRLVTGDALFEASSREYWRQGFQFFATITVSSLWFVGTTLFWRRTPAAERKRIEEFFTRFDTPVDFAKEEGAATATDGQQARVIGWLSVAMGALVLLLAAFPNPPVGRLAFLACGLPPCVVGGWLVVSARRFRGEGLPPNRKAAAIRTPVVFAALTRVEAADFLPEPLDGELRSLARRVDTADPTGWSTADLTRALTDSGAEVLLSCWKTPALPAVLPPQLRYVCHLAGSVKQMVSRAEIERGLLVTNWGASISRVVAEGALLHILACLRRSLAWSIAMHREGAWKDERTETASLFGRRVGLHGFGRVARELVRLLRPFDVAITAWAPDVTPEVEREWQVRRAESLESLFRDCDVVVELAPLLPETRQSVQEKHLRLLRPGAVFVNIGRGDLVDEAALVRVAREGRVQFGLDVFATEPLPAVHPLRELANVTLTPHIAGPTSERRRDAGAWALANLRAYTTGAPVAGRITPEGYDGSA